MSGFGVKGVFLNSATISGGVSNGLYSYIKEEKGEITPKYTIGFRDYIHAHLLDMYSYT